MKNIKFCNILFFIFFILKVNILITFDKFNNEKFNNRFQKYLNLKNKKNKFNKILKSNKVIFIILTTFIAGFFFIKIYFNIKNKEKISQYNSQNYSIDTYFSMYPSDKSTISSNIPIKYNKDINLP